MAVAHLPPLEQRRLVALAQAGDRRARDTLLRTNEGLCWRVIHKVNRFGRGSNDDLLQEALLGLNHAIDRYDATKGANFATYAQHWIRACVQVEYSQQLAPVSIGSHGVLAAIWGIRTVTSGQSPERAQEIRAAISGTVRLDAPLGHDGDTTHGDLLDSEELDAEALLAEAQTTECQRALIERFRAGLDPKQAVVFEHRMLNGERLEAVGQRLGVSRERARQIEKRVTERLLRIAETVRASGDVAELFQEAA